MSFGLPHLIVVPVVLPLVAAATALLLGRQRRRLQSLVNVGATTLGLGVATAILWAVEHADEGAIHVYLASNWEAPFGIVLVADRVSALLLVVTGMVSLAAVIYATAGWSRAGVYFHSLFQIQLMGLNGAFLTGDLFNLFVFFEVMLAASYGLQLHGSGWPRVHSGLHYIVVNLIASTLFLIGLALLYGVMGTLNMADLVAKLGDISGAERTYVHIGGAILGMAFLTKAALWPLNFWLVPAYTAASAPVAALFALMTKVGVYALLRLSSLFTAAPGGTGGFGSEVLYYGGLATIAFGTLGLVASLRLGRIASYSIVVSAGTLLAAIGYGAASVTSAALYYLVSASLGASALFLLVELIERGDGQRRPMPEPDLEPGEDTNLDDEEEALVGRVIPVSLAILGLTFITTAVVVAGLPPLSGFVGKVTMLAALLSPEGLGTGGEVAPRAWWLFGLLLVSGLAATVSLTRVGIQHFWSPAARLPAQMKVVEVAPIVGLLVACVWLAARGEPVMTYTNAAASSLYSPRTYIESVYSTRPKPGPTRPAPDEEGTP